MKQAKFIISQLVNQPSFKKLKQTASHKRLLALLPPRYQKAVKFMYNKNSTLYFVLENHIFKTELNYKKELIKGLLKKLIQEDDSCRCIDAEELKFFETNKTSYGNEKQKKDKNIYIEKSFGEFENCAKNERLNLLFEEIRKVIKR